MVQMIEELHHIQYSVYRDERWVYNVRNDRMIVSKQPLENYLGEMDDSANPLYDFYHSPYKRGTFTNFHLLRMIVNSSKIDFFHKLVLFLINRYSMLVMLALSILYLLRFSEQLQYSVEQFSLSQFSVGELGMIYLTAVGIVLPLHEYAHFSVYYKYWKPPKVTFGFSIRYFSMPVFFIKVPFYRLLSDKKQNELILAGIKCQVAIWFFLSVLHMVNPSHFVSGLLIVNLGLIVTNLLPFLKLDGYWYLSNFLKVDDYMIYFKNMFSSKATFRIDILILGILNYILIALSIWSFTHNIITLFT